MVNVENEENLHYYDEANEEYEKYIQLLKNIDENQAVSFPSCNEDTYIKKVADCYLISTCNNTDWKLGKYNKKLTENATAELKKLKKLYNKGSDSRRNIKYVLKYQDEFSEFGNDYYALNTGIIGVETYEQCSICKHEYIWNTQKYGKICLKCSPLLKRKEKLETINKINE